jgi:hypothetical protein
MSVLCNYIRKHRFGACNIRNHLKEGRCNVEFNALTCSVECNALAVLRVWIVADLSLRCHQQQIRCIDHIASAKCHLNNIVSLLLRLIVVVRCHLRYIE